MGIEELVKLNLQKRRHDIENRRQAYDILWNTVLAAILREKGIFIHMDEARRLPLIVDDYADITYFPAIGQDEREPRQNYYVLPVEYYRGFLTQLRPDPQEYFCYALCCIHYEDGEDCWFVERNIPTSHAEKCILEHLKNEMEKQFRKVDIFITWSPCEDCSRRITDFVKEFPAVQLSITCSSVYKCSFPAERDGLRALHDAGVKLRGFSDTTWETLQDHLVRRNE